MRSGYVRVLWELWAAGLADEDIAAGWRAAMAGWRSLLESVFVAWADGLALDLPISARAVATLIGNLFEGIEIELLAGRLGRGGLVEEISPRAMDCAAAADLS